MKKLIFIAICFSCINAFSQQPGAGKNADWQNLFEKNNFSGWYSFLQYKGKNNDPDKVFNISNGELHITGKEFGYLSTEKLYENFHLILDFKWGKKKWPPREADSTKRDNGILFYVPENEKDTVWMKSIECQIQEGDVGDFWMIDSTTIVVNGSRTTPKDYFRVAKTADGEKPTGEWNHVEIIADRGHIIYLVNGIKVNEADSPSVTKGKIVIQSEGAEIYLKNIRIAEL